jgi:adenosylhomocysteine nucleosidase
MSKRIAIVAALEREARPAVRSWRVIERKHEGRTFKFYETEHAALVCGGIGAAAARRATEAMIALYEPSVVVSLGFAGALSSELKVGDLFTPQQVINLADGSRVETGCGRGILLCAGSVTGKDQKLKLFQAYGAQAIDMESAAVARGAEARGIAFHAVKAISDEVGFEMPAMEGAIDSQGKFRTGRFLLFAILRPRWWLPVLRLAKNSSRAAITLSTYLSRYNQGAEILDKTAVRAHPIGKN